MNLGFLKGFIDSKSYKEYEADFYFSLNVNAHGIDLNPRASRVLVRMKNELAKNIMNNRSKYENENDCLIIIGLIQTNTSRGILAENYILESELEAKGTTVSEFLLSNLWRSL
ncbi:hypothetical protein [Spiroplasma alleghenense]|uniref:Uncharacterized protein n=1 Tax=Spiroplasma alleghenense TaxID=216931 RepID=A0A345Z4U2_9MOLU|nr:hypothetical protein [Spiroplasma alleghenense]AXK51621.1 hypothetical protein SALLE_v1c09510 [Spiroplasma alleghenense]